MQIENGDTFNPALLLQDSLDKIVCRKRKHQNCEADKCTIDFIIQWYMNKL